VLLPWLFLRMVSLPCFQKLNFTPTEAELVNIRTRRDVDDYEDYDDEDDEDDDIEDIFDWDMIEDEDDEDDDYDNEDDDEDDIDDIFDWDMIEDEDDDQDDYDDEDDNDDYGKIKKRPSSTLKYLNQTMSTTKYLTSMTTSLPMNLVREFTTFSVF
jgi:hypothetical protein